MRFAAVAVLCAFAAQLARPAIAAEPSSQPASSEASSEPADAPPSLDGIDEVLLRRLILGPLPPCARDAYSCARRDAELLDARLDFAWTSIETLISHAKDADETAAIAEYFAADAYKAARDARQALKERPLAPPAWYWHPALWASVGALVATSLIFGCLWAVGKAQQLFKP